MDVIRDGHRRKVHKAILRYHDSDNWPILREALIAMGRSDLIGNTPKHLIPAQQPGEKFVHDNRTVVIRPGVKPKGKKAFGRSRDSAAAKKK